MMVILRPICFMLVFASGMELAIAQTTGLIRGKGTLESSESSTYTILSGKTTERSGALSATKGKFKRPWVSMPKQKAFVKYEAPAVDRFTRVKLSAEFFDGPIPSLPWSSQTSTASRWITVLPQSTRYFRKLGAFGPAPTGTPAVRITVSSAPAPGGGRQYTYIINPLPANATQITKVLVKFDSPMTLISQPLNMTVTTLQPTPAKGKGPATLFGLYPKGGALTWAKPFRVVFEGDVTAGGVATFYANNAGNGMAKLKVAGPQ